MKLLLPYSNLMFQNRCITLFLLFLWPFGAVILSLIQLIRRQDFGFNVLVCAVFMGLFGYVMNARYDLSIDMTRIYDHYDIMQEMSFIEALPYFPLRGDLSLLTLWLLGLSGLNAQIVGFFTAFVFYFTIIWSADKWMRLVGIRNQNMLYECVILIMLCMTHPLTISGVRTPIAVSLFVIGCLLYFDDQKKWAFLLMILSVANHFGLLLMVLIFYFGVGFNRRIVRIVCLVLILGAGIYKGLMSFLLDMLSSGGILGVILASKIDYYMFGEDVEELRLSIGSRIWLIQTLLLGIVFAIIELSPALRHRLKGNSYAYKLELLIWLLLAFMAFNLSNVIMVVRSLVLLNFFLALMIVAAVGLCQNQRLYQIFIGCACLVFLIMTVSLFKEYGIIPEYMIAYEYLPRLLYDNFPSLLGITIDYK